MLYINSLDTYRFFAFSIVFLAHITLLLNIGLNKLYIGDLGVSMFFVLSGFLITTILWTQVKEKDGISLKAFYIKRSKRIWPLYFLIIFIGLFLIPAFYTTEIFKAPFTNLDANPFWQYLTFTFNFFNEKHFVQNTLITTMLWSICVEEQFYLIWPIFLKYFGKIKNIVYFLSTLFVVSFLFRYFNYTDSAQIEFNTLSVMNDLVVGSTLAFIYYYNKSRLEQFVTVKYFALSSFIFMFLVYFRSEFFVGDRLWISVEPILFSLVFAYFLLCFIKFKNWKVLNIPLFLYFGRISYGLYVYHILSFFISIQIVNWINKFYPVSKYFQVIFAIPILLLISHYSYKYFEKYFMVRRVDNKI